MTLLFILLTLQNLKENEPMKLLHAIEAMAPMLNRLPEGVNGRALLAAIAQVESTGGERSEASRFEPGLVDDTRKAHPEAYKRWGHRLCQSFGAMQILGVTAFELGMEGPPERLAEHEYGVFWGIQYLNRRGIPSALKANPPTIEAFIRAVGDAYNSGNATDRIKPVGYMDKLWDAYQVAERTI